VTLGKYQLAYTIFTGRLCLLAHCPVRSRRLIDAGLPNSLEGGQGYPQYITRPVETYTEAHVVSYFGLAAQLPKLTEVGLAGTDIVDLVNGKFLG